MNMLLFQMKTAQLKLEDEGAFRARMEQLVKTAVAEVSLERKAGFSVAGNFGWDSREVSGPIAQNAVTVILKGFSGSRGELLDVANKVAEKVLKALEAHYKGREGACSVSVQSTNTLERFDFTLDIGRPAFEEKKVPGKQQPSMMKADPNTRYTDFLAPGKGGGAS